MKTEEKIILDEIFEAISAIKAELSRLEGLAEELALKPVEAEEAAPAPVAEPEPVVEVAAEPVVEDVPVEDFDMADSFDMEEEAAAGEPAAPASEPAAPVVPEVEVPADAEPAIVAMAAEKPKAKKAVVDAMLTDEAWRTDMPSSEVKDIRSAIALNDRILLINKLFVGDAEDFQKTVAALNEMSSLDEAVDFLKERYADWKWNSDLVYRFMMAVRRKIR